MQAVTKSTKNVCRSTRTETIFVTQLIPKEERKGSCQDNSHLFTFSPKVSAEQIKESSYDAQEEPTGFKSKAKQ